MSNAAAAAAAAAASTTAATAALAAAAAKDAERRRVALLKPTLRLTDISDKSERAALSHIVHQAALECTDLREVATYVQDGLARLDGGGSKVGPAQWTVLAFRSLSVQARQSKGSAAKLRVPCFGHQLRQGAKTAEDLPKDAAFGLLVFKASSDEPLRGGRLRDLPREDPAWADAFVHRPADLTSKAGTAPQPSQPPRCSVLRSTMTAPLQSVVLGVIGGVQAQTGLSSACEQAFLDALKAGLTAEYGTTWHAALTQAGVRKAQGASGNGGKSGSRQAQQWEESPLDVPGFALAGHKDGWELEMTLEACAAAGKGPVPEGSLPYHLVVWRTDPIEGGGQAMPRKGLAAVFGKGSTVFRLALYLAGIVCVGLYCYFTYADGGARCARKSVQSYTILQALMALMPVADSALAPSFRAGFLRPREGLAAAAPGEKNQSQHQSQTLLLEGEVAHYGVRSTALSDGCTEEAAMFAEVRQAQALGALYMGMLFLAAISALRYGMKVWQKRSDRALLASLPQPPSKVAANSAAAGAGGQGGATRSSSSKPKRS